MNKQTENEKLYNSLIDGYAKAFPKKTGKQVQLDVSNLWKQIKKSDDLVDSVNKKLCEWKEKEMKMKGNLFSFWSKIPKSSQKCDLPDQSCAEAKVINKPKVIEVLNGDKEQEQPLVKKQKVAKPKQDVLYEKSCTLQKDVYELTKKRGQGLLSDEERDSLREKKKELDAMNKELLKCKKNAERQQKFRVNFKRKLESLDDETKKKLCINDSKVGKPSKYDEETLIKAITEIAIKGSGADERRRSEVIRSVKTLDDLTSALFKQGFNLSRSSVYLRLLPRNSATREGKRHASSVPVKLLKSKNSKHTKHSDTLFARASISYLEELSSLLGPNEVVFHSQDDKCRVPIGLTAANMQAPLVMHMEYKIKLSDHDFVVAPQHKLIPSVIAAIGIKQNSITELSGVTYSGPTYVAIRSAKHSSSTAEQHLFDMKRIALLPEFQDDMFINGLHKPIMIITVDGGPDENPRYNKTITCAIDYFCTNKLDALFVATNAPGRSAFNRVERRMAPLSHDIAGVVLPHDHFGSHLNSKGETIDKEMEIQNFSYAGKILAEIWSNTVIDGNSVVAEYIDPIDRSDINVIEKSALWKKQHVQESQYFLQIVKCKDNACCEVPRSSYFSVLNGQFLPPPLPLVQSADGLQCKIDDGNAQYPSLFVTLALNKSVLPPRALKQFPKHIPYDFACPSVQNVLQKRMCNFCSYYCASIRSITDHMKTCDKKVNNGIGQVSTSVPKIRPQRLAAKRQRELMCLVKYMENHEYEWHDLDDVDTTGLDQPMENSVEDGTPIINVDDRVPVWIDV